MALGVSVSLLRILALFYASYSHVANAAFTYSSPAQCNDLTITWSGGTSPYSLLLAPHLQPARNISIPSSAWNGTYGDYTFQLQLSSETTFLIVLSDATGFGSLGTTGELTVNTTDSTCDTSTPTPAFDIAFNTTNLQQCRDFTFSGFSGASKPITVHGLIPGGEAFDINVPSSSSNSYDWTADVALGTTVLFVPVDSQGKFATSSDFLGVGASSISSCLNSSSPQTTSAQPSSSAGGSPTASSSSGTASPSKSGGAHGGSPGNTSVGATVGIAVGSVLAVIIAGTLLFFFLIRKLKARKEAAAAAGGEAYGFEEGKGRQRNRIDLLPGGGGRGDPEEGDAAHYPLAARRSGAQGVAGTGPDADYEPVPYVLPPGEGSENGETDAHGRTSTSTRPLSRGGESTILGGATSAAGSKSAMATMDRQNTQFAPNAPARFLVHEDAGSVDGDEDEEGEYSEEEEEVVDLPPQYNSLGVLVSPERRPSRRRSTRRPISGASDSLAPGGAVGSSRAETSPIPPIPEGPDVAGGDHAPATSAQRP